MSIKITTTSSSKVTSSNEELLNSNHSENSTHSSQAKKVSDSSDSTLLQDRAAIKTITISPEQFCNLITSQNFDQSTHYKVEGDVQLDDLQDSITLPEELTIEGNFTIVNKLINLTVLAQEIVGTRRFFCTLGAQAWSHCLKASMWQILFIFKIVPA